MPDRYDNFADLAEHETGGTDYRICVMARNLLAAIIVPHGGRIEPATTEIAVAIYAANSPDSICDKRRG